MAKKDEGLAVEVAKLQALEQENRILRQQIADQEALQESQKGIVGDRLASEIKKIRKQGQSQANTIGVGVNADYKPVTLWTKWCKPIGPMHPDNAIQTLNRFADVGVALSIDKPTTEQLDAYSKTAENQKRVERENAKRVSKEKSRKAGQMEKFTAEIAKLSGTTAEAVNRILQAHEVKSKA
jgi:hypothetical protein